MVCYRGCNLHPVYKPWFCKRSANWIPLYKPWFVYGVQFCTHDCFTNHGLYAGSNLHPVLVHKPWFGDRARGAVHGGRSVARRSSRLRRVPIVANPLQPCWYVREPRPEHLEACGPPAYHPQPQTMAMHVLQTMVCFLGAICTPYTNHGLLHGEQSAPLLQSMVWRSKKTAALLSHRGNPLQPCWYVSVMVRSPTPRQSVGQTAPGRLRKAMA